MKDLLKKAFQSFEEDNYFENNESNSEEVMETSHFRSNDKEETLEELLKRKGSLSLGEHRDAEKFLKKRLEETIKIDLDRAKALTKEMEDWIKGKREGLDSMELMKKAVSLCDTKEEVAFVVHNVTVFLARNSR